MRLDAKASTAGSTQRLPGRLIPAATLTTLLGLLALLSIGASTAAAADCPNEIRRQEQGIAALALPDCRAYEIASPGSQPHVGGSVQGGTEPGKTSISGDRVLYRSIYPALGEEHSGQFYVSTRGANGWLPRNVIPQMSTNTAGLFACAPEVFFSPDLSRHVLEQDLHPYGEELFCQHSEELLDPREAVGYRTLLLHDGATDLYELIELNPEGTPPRQRLDP